MLDMIIDVVSWL